MAEQPRLYLPRWSDDIMTEVSRNFVSKFNKTEAQARHREDEIRKAFPSAWVDEGYKLLTNAMPNDCKDRHVPAAAVRSALNPFGIACTGPSTFLRNLYDLEPAIATRKLAEQAEDIGISLEAFLMKLRLAVPGFVDFICEELQIRTE